MSNHKFVHIEIPASDPKAAGKFYADLFGWKIEAFAELDYVTFDGGEGPGGGFPKVGDDFKPGDVTAYIGVDDIDATLANIEKMGGKTITPKSEIPQTGWYAIFSDPTGNKLGLYTAIQS